MQLIPNARAQFIDSSGMPLASGSVGFYFPGTLNPKATFQDPAGTIANPNPVPLDSRGQALIWGSGVYRQILKDASGVTIWDGVTEDANAGLTGNITDDTFVAGDGTGKTFIPGTTTQLTLDAGPGSVTNTWIFFDAAYQADNQIASLNGVVLTFNDPIPDGVETVTVKIGTTIALGMVNDTNVQAGSKLFNRINDFYDVRDFGAIGNSTADDSASFTNVPSPLLVTPCPSSYLIKKDTTITSDLIFMGGSITVPAGVTLTINGTIKAPHKVIFKGDGTVKVANGSIDCAWFDGADAAAKFAFLARGLDSSNTLTKTVEFYTPDATDAWSVVSTQNQWGRAWACDTPIKVTQLCGGTRFMTYAPFVSRSGGATSLWDMGNGATKADGWHFPLPLLLDGNALGGHGMLIEGASDFTIHSIDAHGVVSALILEPNGAKQVSGFRIGPIIVGESTGTGVVIAGDSAVNSVSDGMIDYAYSTGLTVAGANVFVEIDGNVQNVKFVQGVIARAVNAGRFDYALSAVAISNKNGFSPVFGLDIGYVISASNSPSSRAVTVTDNSGGTAPKISGVTVRGGIASVAPAFSFDYCVGLKAYDIDAGAITLVGAGAVSTQLYGVNAANVTDNGAGTLINGKSKRPIVSTAVNPSPSSFTNTGNSDVDFQLQGGTVTTVNLTRGATTVSAFSGVSLNAGLFQLSPGDTIQFAFSAAPSANIIPR